MTGMIQNLVNTINEAYENGECRIDEDLPIGERGDGLADFIANEVRETCEGSDPNEIQDIAINELSKAVEQLQGVIAAIEKMD